jgi:hypothetical protein
VGIGKYHPFRREFVGMGSRDLAGPRGEALNVSITEVIADDVDNVGGCLLSGPERKYGKKKQGQEKSFHGEYEKTTMEEERSDRSDSGFSGEDFTARRCPQSSELS